MRKLWMNGLGIGLATVLVQLFSMATAWAQEPEKTGDLSALPPLWWIAPVGVVLALIFARKFFNFMKKASPGNETMVKIAGHVQAGAMAYLKRQYRVVIVFFLVTGALLAVMAFVLKVQSGFVPFAFFTGGFFSGLCGYIGMRTATHASSRTAQGARESLNRGLQIAFRSGAVMGLVVAGLALLDTCNWFLILYWVVPALGFPELSLFEITVTMLSFGMGASSQALFARVGGGIFTKAADVGADLVGKVEAGIPEDDPRNPATIADNVGDNVGDVAGMGADLYESYAGSILATAALGVAAAHGFGLEGAELFRTSLNLLCAPMALAGLGIILSLIGIFTIRTGETASQGELLKALFRGINLSSVLVAVAAFGLCYWMIRPIQEFVPDFRWWGVFGSVIVGLVSGLLIGRITTYYTSDAYRPTQDIAKQTSGGPATVIIAGLAEGMMSTGGTVIVICVAIFLSYLLPGGATHPALGLYGVAFAAVGMLSTLGITLATDAYGPIADNAGGNAEMSGLEPQVRERTDVLDALGNTTAATGKGFAIGSAALTALALLAAYVEQVRIGADRVVAQAAAVEQAQVYNQDVETDQELHKVPNQDLYYASRTVERDGKSVEERTSYISVGRTVDGTTKVTEIRKATLADFMEHYQVSLMNPKVLIGLMLGAMMTFVFCALTMKAVGRAAAAMVEEVRRQFREITGLMEGKAEADYAACVTISTDGALREMIIPSLLAIVIPVAVGIVLGVPAVMGLLAGALCAGFSLAIMMANAGGAWDNAKKHIEGGAHGGKGSAAHKAAVVGDTVGDPFKDTSGPSLNILIKLMSMVSVVFAGLTVKWSPMVSNWLGM